MNGAEAMGLAKETGELVPGKQAGIVLLSLDRLGLTPCLVDGNADQCASMLVNAASSRDVGYVISNGEMVVQNGRLIKIDEQETAISLQAVGNELQSRMLNGVARVVDVRITDPIWYQYQSVRKKDSVNDEALDPPPVERRRRSAASARDPARLG